MPGGFAAAKKWKLAEYIQQADVPPPAHKVGRSREEEAANAPTH